MTLTQPKVPGAVSGHLLSEAKALLDSTGPTCGVMLLHRAALEAILADHGLANYHLFDKLKAFLSGNSLFSAHESHLLDLKRRGDSVAHEGIVCDTLSERDRELIKADHRFLMGMYEALYSHRQAEYIQRQKAELIRRKRGAGPSGV
jgi:hypothetical protein